MGHQHPRVIVALDFDSSDAVFKFIDSVDLSTCAVKVGHELFARCGLGLVDALVARRFDVFLDLKFHDIPNTVARACRAVADHGVWMLNVHALGGLRMMTAARNALNSFSSRSPLLIAVTLLTSMGSHDLCAVGLSQGREDAARRLATLAYEAGLDGVVAAASDVICIKQACGDHFLAVTPGIRFVDDAHHDQIMVVTPQHAQRMGSDYLVVGRSITQAVDPQLRLHQLLTAIREDA